MDGNIYGYLFIKQNDEYKLIEKEPIELSNVQQNYIQILPTIYNKL